MDTTTTPPTLYVVAKINNAHVWCSPSDYVPGTPADWVGAPPTTIAEAINRIAALIGPVP